MVTINFSNVLNVVDAGAGEARESFWDRFLKRLELVLSGASGLTPEQIEDMEPEDLRYLGNHWFMY